MRIDYWMQRLVGVHSIFVCGLNTNKITSIIALIILISSLPLVPSLSYGFIIKPRAIERTHYFQQVRRATPIVSSPESDSWSEFYVSPGDIVDINRMEVIASDYSDDYEMDTVLECKKPGMEFAGTMTQRAEVIVSLGSEPEELIAESGGPKIQQKFDLAENEYIVDRGTKLDKLRMYVVSYEQSIREGGTVLRTLRPGVLAPDGSSVTLAEVVVSSGQDGTWREDKIGEAIKNDDGNPGQRSRGMVAFSSSSLGPPGGPGQQAGYTFGSSSSTKPKSSQHIPSSKSKEKEDEVKPLGRNISPMSQQDSQNHYSQNVSYENSSMEKHNNLSKLNNNQEISRDYPQAISNRNSQRSSASFPQSSFESTEDINIDMLREKFQQLGNMIEDIYNKEPDAATPNINSEQSVFQEDSSNSISYQLDNYNQSSESSQTIISGLQEVLTDLRKIKNRKPEAGKEIHGLQQKVLRLQEIFLTSNRIFSDPPLEQKVETLTQQSNKWNVSIGKMQAFVARREMRVSAFRQHLDQLLADYIASENEMMNLVEECFMLTEGSNVGTENSSIGAKEIENESMIATLPQDDEYSAIPHWASPLGGEETYQELAKQQRIEDEKQLELQQRKWKNNEYLQNHNQNMHQTQKEENHQEEPMKEKRQEDEKSESGKNFEKEAKQKKSSFSPFGTGAKQKPRNSGWCG